jgi:hypothetical protein
MIWLKILGPILAGILVFGTVYKCGSDAGTKADAARSDKIIGLKDKLILDCQGDLAKATQTVTDQNGTITGLKTAAESRAKEAEADLKVAKIEANTFRKRALELASAKPGPDQCQSARELLVQQIGQDRQ